MGRSRFHDGGRIETQEAITIVVVVGTSLMGGRGGIGLTAVGTLIIGYLDKILSINVVSESNRLMLTGTIIIAAVLAQRQGSRTRTRMEES